jgi:tryptophan synthase alpha chain
LTLEIPADRLAQVFARRASKGQSVLIPYVTAGFPDRESTGSLLLGLADAGADVIELGIPFSDPMADGPTIQASSFEALEGGMTLAGALDLLREFRAKRETPVVVFTYLNPVVRFGVDRFLDQALSAGADGLLLTDLPAGADPEMEGRIDRSGLALIRLVAPTTEDDRLETVTRGARGFLYYISRTGVTGARTDLRTELEAEVERLRARVTLPVAVGFGISTPGQAARVAGVADGVVVGSALIKAQQSGGVPAAVAFVRSLREAMDQGVG